MRYLLDACVTQGLLVALRQQGLDAVRFPGAPGASDIEVLTAAKSTNRVLITNDKDFGEMVIRDGGAAPGVILLRVEAADAASAASVAKRISSLTRGGLGAFTAISAKSVRVRRLEPPEGGG